MSEFTFWSIMMLFTLIGFVGGMLFNRWQYMDRLRKKDRTIRKLERRCGYLHN